MKFCPHCGKPLQFEQAEICPACGCRVNAIAGGIDRAAVLILIAILAVLCIIAAGVFHLFPGTAEKTPGDPVAPAVTGSPDSSLSVAWTGTEDWEPWKHAASWSGKTVGPCAENGPKIVDGHGEYGTEVNLLAGTTESGVWRTFTDTSGNGWNTLTFVGKMSPCDVPGGRWMKIDVNDRVVYRATASESPPGNGKIFTIPVHFPLSKTVKVTISNGQDPAWGTTFKMEYYSLRLSREADTS